MLLPQADAIGSSNVSQLDTRLPDPAYTEAAVFEVELKQIFAQSWLPVGRAQELGEPGSYFTWERTRIPTVLMRSVDRGIRGFYNSCRHRGAPVVRTPTGRARAFRCQYHSWTYDTFGKLMAIPDERDFGNIDRCAYSLVPLRTADLGGWLWIDQSGTAPELPEVLGEAAAWLAAQPDRAATHRATATVAANWKAVVERLAEGDGPVAGANGHWHLPNTLFLADDAATRMIAAWAVDERTTTIELVTAADTIDEAAEAALLAKLVAVADGIATAGFGAGGPGQIAQELARDWRRAMHGAA